MTSPRSRQSLIVQYAAAGDDLPARPLLRRWIRATLAAEVENTKVVLRFVEEAESRALNRRYRRRDRATNVLSFVYDDDCGADGHCLNGDIVLCVPVLRREATQQGKPLAAHCAHLVVHGMLHLQGYDHAKSREVVRMEAREIAILARLGFGNPYVMNPSRGTTRPRRIRR
jgi:probable rRNA maturation factor